MDTLTEELLTSLAHNLQGAAILLLCTYRPGYRAPWLDLSYARQLSLQPLTPRESADVIGAVMGGDELPERFVEAVVERAEGNPFFARGARPGLPRRHDEGAAVAVPGTVHDVLAARIDLLPDAPRRLLRTASVIGREFSPRLLEPPVGRGLTARAPPGGAQALRVRLRADRHRRARSTSSRTPSPTRSPTRASS